MTIGIYKITNSLNGKCYVGQSWDIEKRWRRYYGLDCKAQVKLYNALKKYGLGVFTFEVLQSFAPDSITQTGLDACEQSWMTQLQCVAQGYNIRQAGSRGRHSVSTIEKMRAVKTGKTHTSETKDKIRAIRTGTSLTEGTKDKMSLSNRFQSISADTQAKREDPLHNFDEKYARRLAYHEQKVKSARGSGRPKEPMPQATLDQMTQLYQSGHSLGAIAKQVGYSHPTVRKYLKQVLTPAELAAAKAKHGIA